MSVEVARRFWRVFWSPLRFILLVVSLGSLVDRIVDWRNLVFWLEPIAFLVDEYRRIFYPWVDWALQMFFPQGVPKIAIDLATVLLLTFRSWRQGRRLLEYLADLYDKRWRWAHDAEDRYLGDLTYEQTEFVIPEKWEKDELKWRKSLERFEKRQGLYLAMIVGLVAVILLAIFAINWFYPELGEFFG